MDELIRAASGILQALKDSSNFDNKKFINTGLKSISGKSDIALNVNIHEMGSTLNKMREAIKIDIPLERTRHLQLIDGYQSATIEGANTTIDNVLSGKVGKSEIMVKQSFAGLQYLLDADNLSEETLLNAWKIIVKDCCENASAGIDGYRTDMVYVGNATNIVHIPASPEMIQFMIQSMLNYGNEFVIINAVVYGFYTVYVHPFADGNGRLSRAIMQKIIGIPALPLSKVISLKLNDYYKSIRLSEEESDGFINITPFYEYMLSVINESCDLLKLYTKPLNQLQSTLLERIDKSGRGFISYAKAAKMLDVDFDIAKAVIDSLCNIGYLEYLEDAGSFKLIWR